MKRSSEPTASKNPWLSAVGLGLGALYLPQLSALVIGPLKECEHCVETFFELFFILPGLIPAILLRAGDRPGLAGVVALALALGAVLTMRRFRQHSRLIGVAIAAMSALNSLAVSHALRA